MTFQFGKKTIAENAAAEPAAATDAPLPESAKQAAPEAPPKSAKAAPSRAANIIREHVLLRIDPLAAVRMSKAELTTFVNALVAEIASEREAAAEPGRAGRAGHRHRR